MKKVIMMVMAIAMFVMLGTGCVESTIESGKPETKGEPIVLTKEESDAVWESLVEAAEAE